MTKPKVGKQSKHYRIFNPFHIVSFSFDHDLSWIKAESHTIMGGNGEGVDGPTPSSRGEKTR